MRRHLLSNGLAATVVAVVMVLAPGFRPSPLVVVVACCVGVAFLAARTMSAHRHGGGGAGRERPPSRMIRNA